MDAIRANLWGWRGWVGLGVVLVLFGALALALRSSGGVLVVRGQATERAVEGDGEVLFRDYELFVNVGDRGLAAYQVEVAVERGAALIVGLEGGEAAAFKGPPYYDPAALHPAAGQKSRIIVAAFSTGADLPRGKVRVARLHMQVSGAERPEFAVKVVVAAGADGGKIPATARLEEGERR